MVIRNCAKEEIPQLINFLKQYWKPNHILVTHPEMLLWQYQNDTGGLNFLIAKEEDNINSDILALLGYIPLAHFDKNLVSNKECWGAIWKVSPKCRIPGLGTFLQKKICNLYNYYGGLSLSNDSIRIQHTLSKSILTVNQYFILNPSIKDYIIACIPSDFVARKNAPNGNCQLREIDDISSCTIKHAYAPIKSIEFLINRYKNHPWYKYSFLACYVNNAIHCILVIRKINVNDRTAIRIVDVYGDLSNVTGLGFQLEKYLMSQPKAEYIDLCNYGINQDFFIENGFNILDVSSDKIIIPNYFEPFEKRNIPIVAVTFSKTDKNYTYFKADADQDRPNIL